MNSMADALSHQCLLYFAADFGVSGALVSALEVGEAFLSCDGEEPFLNAISCTVIRVLIFVVRQESTLCHSEGD